MQVIVMNKTVFCQEVMRKNSVTSNEGDDDDDIPTEPWLNEASDKYIREVVLSLRRSQSIGNSQSC